MVCPLSLHGITDDQDQKKNCRSDKFQVGRLYDPHGNNESDTRFIENCACDNSGGCLQLSEAVNSCVPRITLARPKTMVPVPIEMSKNA